MCTAYSQAMISGHRCPSAVPQKTGQTAHAALGICLAGWPQTSIFISNQESPESFLALMHVMEMSKDRGWGQSPTVVLWDEDGVMRESSPLISFKAHPGRCGIFCGQISQLRDPRVAGVELAVVPCSFAIYHKSLFHLSIPKLGRCSLLLSQNLFGSPIPRCFGQSSAIMWLYCFAAEIDLCLESNGGCHTNAECIKTGPRKVSM